MGKRSNFERVSHDLYDTPFEAVVPLSRFLHDVTAFIEPCAGHGMLIGHLEALGYSCALALDLVPAGDGIEQGDALNLDYHKIMDAGLEPIASHFITNPPWPAGRGRGGEPTMSLIRHLSSLLPTWMLLSADFMHNAYASTVLTHCFKIVSVGRVKWMPGSEHVGKENCAWYLFDKEPAWGDNHTKFFGRGDGQPVYANEIEELL